jgi:hypothetical protein
LHEMQQFATSPSFTTTTTRGWAYPVCPQFLFVF